LEKEGELLTSRQVANVFAHSYKNVSHIPDNREQQREARREHALKITLRKLKTKTSFRPDGVTNEMFIHLESTAMSKLLVIFTHSWCQGHFPQIRSDAILIPTERTKEGYKQFHQLYCQDNGNGCECTYQMMHGDQQFTCNTLDWFPPKPKQQYLHRESMTPFQE